MTVEQKLKNVANVKSQLRSVLASSGANIIDAKFSDYPNLFQEVIQQGDLSGTWNPTESNNPYYIRPAEREAIQLMSDYSQMNDNTIYMLYKVLPEGFNDIFFTITTSNGAYNVNWGDGTQEDILSGIKAKHFYTYEDLTSVTPTENNEKYVWIVVTIVENNGSFTSLNMVQPEVFGNRPSGKISYYRPPIYEIHMKAPNISTIVIGVNQNICLSDLQEFELLGTNQITVTTGLIYMFSLEKLVFDTTTVTNASNFLTYCISFNQCINNFNFSNCINFTNFLSSCSNFNNGNQTLNIDTAKGNNFTNFLSGCTSFNQFLSIDTAQCTVFSNFLYSCTRYNNSINNLDFSNCSTISGFLSSCTSFNQPININTQNVITLTNFLLNCTSFNQHLDLNLSSCTNLSGFLNGCTSYNYPVDHIDFSNNTNFSNFLSNTAFNQELNIDTSNGITFTNFLSNCRAFNKRIDNLDFSKGTSFNYFLANCVSFNQPIEGIDFSKSTNHSYFLQGSYSFNQSIDLNLPLVTTLQYFLGGSTYSKFNKPIKIIAPLCTTVASFLYNSYSFNSNIDITIPMCNTFTSFMNACYCFDKSVTLNIANMSANNTNICQANTNQTGLRLQNWPAIFAPTSPAIWNNMCLGRQALVDLFGDLYNRAGNGLASITLTFSGNPGWAQLTSEDKQIATDNGWIIN